MIVISGNLIERQKGEWGSNNTHFSCWDDGDAYNLLYEQNIPGSIPGTIYHANGQEEISISDFGNVFDRTRVIVRWLDNKTRRITGYIRNKGSWEKVPVQIIPVRQEIFSRFGGLIETDVLSNKKVFVVGFGSGGSHIGIECTKSGVMNFIIMDHDRLEIGNVSRHAAGISHVGRYKAYIAVDLIKDRNPYAKVQPFDEEANWDNSDKLRTIIQQVHLVICATDNRESKRLINRFCVEEKTTCIFAGAFRRAYGGQILFVRPFKSLCYQCFCMLLPELAADQEISSRKQAERLAYTDRPVAIEPGLSNDIAPISNMVVKLTIQELLKETDTTLRSLDDDLVAPFYIWLNRREKGTQYENLEPLEFNVDGMHILRWYGIDIERHPDCPVCGNEKKLFDEL